MDLNFFNRRLIKCTEVSKDKNYVENVSIVSIIKVH